MHEIDLSSFDLRTDLIIENNIDNVKNNHYIDDDIEISDIYLSENNSLNKKEGKYISITFDDITDSNNYQKVMGVFIKEFLKILKYCKIKSKDKCLIIGLGNNKIISDALGSKTLEHIIVTRHLYLLNNVDEKYRNVAILEPKVMGITGIDSFEIIKNVVSEIKPDFIIAIDSLCAINIKRLNKVIQISSSGITPGSGIGNTRTELSIDTLGVPVIAVGVPTVVDSTVIVSNAINYLMKKVSYLKKNINNNKDKLKPIDSINYLVNDNELNDIEKKELLGYIGLLKENDLEQLIWEVLSPIDANLIVTPKEIDFLIEKMGNLIGEGLNKSLHRES